MKGEKKIAKVMKEFEVIQAVIKLVKEKKQVTAKNIIELTLDTEKNCYERI